MFMHLCGQVHASQQLAFVVEKIDIHSNMDKIGGFFNCLEINKLYDSNHSNKKLFHLIMDFSSNIK